MIFAASMLVSFVLCEHYFLTDHASSSSRHSTSLKIGEALVYDLKIWGLGAGTLSAEIADRGFLEGVDVYHIVYRVKTSGSMRFFFDIDNVINVWVDSVTGLPHKIQKHTNEIGPRTQRYIFFDQDKQEIVLRLTNGNNGGISRTLKMLPRPPGESTREDSREGLPETSGRSERAITEILDPYSLIYYLRLIELNVGWKHFLGVLFDRRIDKVQIEVVKKEVIEVPAGKFDCFVIRQIGGNVRVWISSDGRRIPVKFTVHTGVGKFTAFLNDIGII